VQLKAELYNKEEKYIRKKEELTHAMEELGHIRQERDKYRHRASKLESNLAQHLRDAEVVSCDASQMRGSLPLACPHPQQQQQQWRWWQTWQLIGCGGLGECTGFAEPVLVVHAVVSCQANSCRASS
jgi:hypothetical protein